MEMIYRANVLVYFSVSLCTSAIFSCNPVGCMLKSFKIRSLLFIAHSILKAWSLYYYNLSASRLLSLCPPAIHSVPNCVHCFISLSLKIWSANHKAIVQRINVTRNLVCKIFSSPLFLPRAFFSFIFGTVSLKCIWCTERSKNTYLTKIQSNYKINFYFKHFMDVLLCLHWLFCTDTNLNFISTRYFIVSPQ